MKKDFISILNKFQGWETALQQLHWDAKNLSQHKLCDEIMSDIKDMKDTISEVEQGIENKKFTLNDLVPEVYKCKTLAKFVKDVISDVTTFYKSGAMKGDVYIGLRSEIESFLAKMQRFIYLNNFTINEDRKRSVVNSLNEGKSKCHQIDCDDIEEMVTECIANIKKSVNKGKPQNVTEITMEDVESMVTESVRKITEAKKKSGIDISKKNKGKFTKTKKETGKSTETLTHSKNPVTKKRAIFAQNAAKWKH